MWTQKIDYEYWVETPRPPVKKQVWDGEQFVPITLYRIKVLPNDAVQSWLLKTFGPAGIHQNGRYWDYSKAGDFTVMDEKVYAWYQMKWKNK